ncbi:MAG: rhodanese-like domain-containing protein [Sphingorhabdus sp.]
MRFKFAIALAATSTVLAALPIAAQQIAPAGSPLIDFPGYLKVTQEVAPYRESRLLGLTEFKAHAANDGALLLDARSASAFAEGHIEGAINLPLPDFTPASLAQVIGENPDREILIYCNNNFRNNVRPVVTKARPLALNIGTFINLYGYGYKNVYELGEAVDMDDPAVGWVKGPRKVS